MRVQSAYPKSKGNINRYEHVDICEKALGRPIPEGSRIHHFDENPTNNANTNLVICESHAYHYFLHTRQRIVALGGDPNTEKTCSTCKQMLARENFNRNRFKYDGLANECRPCKQARDRKRSTTHHVR